MTQDPPAGVMLGLKPHSETLRRHGAELSQKDRDEMRAVAKDAVDLAARVVKILIGALR